MSEPTYEGCLRQYLGNPTPELADVDRQIRSVMADDGRTEVTDVDFQAMALLLMWQDALTCLEYRPEDLADATDGQGLAPVALRVADHARRRTS